MLLETRKRQRLHPARQQTRWVNPVLEIKTAIKPDPGWYQALLSFLFFYFLVLGETLREVWYLIFVINLLLARLRALGDGNQILTDLSTERSVRQIGTVWKPNKHTRSRAHKHKAFIHCLGLLRITLLIFSLNLNPCLVALRHPKLSASNLRVCFVAVRLCEFKTLLWMDAAEDLWGLVILEWRVVSQTAVNRNVRNWDVKQIETVGP